MNIDDLTLGQIKEIQSMSSCETTHPYKVGENIFIRTVTHIDVGTLVSVGDKELVLKNVSWIADTGRYADAIANGNFSEVEPYPDEMEVIVGRSAIIDACPWLHKLPREQK